MHVCQSSCSWDKPQPQHHCDLVVLLAAEHRTASLQRITAPGRRVGAHSPVVFNAITSCIRAQVGGRQWSLARSPVDPVFVRKASWRQGQKILKHRWLSSCPTAVMFWSRGLCPRACVATFDCPFCNNTWQTVGCLAILKRIPSLQVFLTQRLWPHVSMTSFKWSKFVPVYVDSKKDIFCRCKTTLSAPRCQEHTQW